jgi:hypothetical protein
VPLTAVDEGGGGSDDVVEECGRGAVVMIVEACVVDVLVCFRVVTICVVCVASKHPLVPQVWPGRQTLQAVFIWHVVEGPLQHTALVV